MSALNYLRDGTLIGRERLMQAREFYQPSRSPLTPELEFSRWTHRIAIQNELGSAREMAGLSDSEMDVLEQEFIRCQTRPPSPWARHGIWAGAVLIALSCVVLASSHIVGTAAGPIGALKALGLGVLLGGAACIAISCLTAFNSLQLDLNHGTTGLYVGLLDEQHPWLYKAEALLRHEAADSYRVDVLRERGPLRGLDYVIMRDRVAAHDLLDRMRPARAVAERLQDLPKPIERLLTEPRLIQVGNRTRAVPAFRQE